MAETVISIRDLWKFYKDFKALENITLDIARGEIFILLGPNGSGKSTLLRIIAGLIARTKGTMQILGKMASTNQYNVQDLRKKIGILFDHSIHWEKLTGYENAWYFARALGLTAEKAKGRVEELLKWADLWDRRDDSVGKYSFGMKRKLALIEALLHDPAILILDEPTIGLDYASRVSFFKLIREKADEGKTIVISTNDVNEASQIGTRIAFINKGSIMASGFPSDLIKSLDALTRIEIKLINAMELSGLKQIDGIDQLLVDEEYKEGTRIWILTKSDKNILSQIVNQIVNLGGSISNLEVQQPGLRDVFLHFTGVSL